MTKTWIESEKQGRGRRYWFQSRANRTAFALQRRAAGYFVVETTLTAWVSFAKKMNASIREQQAGRDPE